MGYNWFGQKRSPEEKVASGWKAGSENDADISDVRERSSSREEDEKRGRIDMPCSLERVRASPAKSDTSDRSDVGA
jgi:hypothetical protein